MFAPRQSILWISKRKTAVSLLDETKLIGNNKRWRWLITTLSFSWKCLKFKFNCILLERNSISIEEIFTIGAWEIVMPELLAFKNVEIYSIFWYLSPSLTTFDIKLASVFSAKISLISWSIPKIYRLWLKDSEKKYEKFSKK